MFYSIACWKTCRSSTPRRACQLVKPIGTWGRVRRAGITAEKIDTWRKQVGGLFLIDQYCQWVDKDTNCDLNILRWTSQRVSRLSRHVHIQKEFLPSSLEVPCSVLVRNRREFHFGSTVPSSAEAGGNIWIIWYPNSTHVDDQLNGGSLWEITMITMITMLLGWWNCQELMTSDDIWIIRTLWGPQLLHLYPMHPWYLLLGALRTHWSQLSNFPSAQRVC